MSKSMRTRLWFSVDHALGTSVWRDFDPAPEDRLVGAGEIANVTQQAIENLEILRGFVCVSTTPARRV